MKMAREKNVPFNIDMDQIRIGDFTWSHSTVRLDEALFECYGAACAHFAVKDIAEKMFSTFRSVRPE